MPKLEREQRLMKRTVLFILVIAMNEAMLYFMKDEYFFNLRVSAIGGWLRIILIVLIAVSVLYYFKEKMQNIEVEKR